MKIVLGHMAWSEEALGWHRALAERARGFGVEVEPLCLVPDPPAPRWSFEELDRRWRQRDRSLLQIREQLIEATRGADVFWNFNGANVHPEWLADLPTLNVYGCFDDPESTEQLSEPVARYFDAALVGNLGCLPLYRSFGLRRVAWAPNAFLGEDCHADLTPEAVRSSDRPIDVVFFGERGLPWRRERLDQLAKAFPSAVFHGHGWPAGFASNAERRRIYRSAKIGWNVHNSVGPVNLRTFMLPAAGVLQIGDNKCRFGEVFRLGEEAVGFDSVGGSMDECIELTRYYLEHDEERRRIAANGRERYARDYAEPRLWDYYRRRLAEWMSAVREVGSEAPRWEPTRRPALLQRLARGAVRRVRERAGLEVRTERTRSHAVRDPEVIGGAVAALVGDAASIAAIGPGADAFAREAAADPDRTVVCSLLDARAIDAALGHRARPNLAYAEHPIGVADGPFDLAVVLDLERFDDVLRDIRPFVALAPRLLVTARIRAHELDAVLRSFYSEVDLYALPDARIPQLARAGLDTACSPLVAECRGPVR